MMILTEVRVVAPPGTTFALGKGSDDGQGKLIVVLRKWDGTWPIEVDERTIQTIGEGSNTFLVKKD